MVGTWHLGRGGVRVSVAARRAHGAIFIGTITVVFLVLTLRYFASIFHAGPIRDEYIPFDASVDPMFFAMWRGGLPGSLSKLWPPPGELGNVGVYSLLLIAGTGAAIWLGARRTLTISVAAILASTWMLRLYYAHRFYQTKLIQLYPRTSAELAYAMLILTGYAIYLAIQWASSRASSESPLRWRSGSVGFLVASLLLFTAAGSATTDRYTPNDDNESMNFVSWVALTAPLLEENQAKDSVVVWPDPQPVATQDHEESIEITMPVVRRFHSVIIHPAEDGFPVDFDIEVWDSVEWHTRVHVTNQGRPPMPLTLAWSPEDFTNRLRLRATKLGAVKGGYALRVGQIEVMR